jgi:hypothetical protein
MSDLLSLAQCRVRYLGIILLLLAPTQKPARNALVLFKVFSGQHEGKIGMRKHV